MEMENIKRTYASFPKKTIELLIVGDYTMVQHHTKEFLPTYLLAVANIVRSFHVSHYARNIQETINFEISLFNYVVGLY